MELKHENTGIEEFVNTLLIVPYGIETLLLLCYMVDNLLLIVPYGIETIRLRVEGVRIVTFNRTLWN